MKRGLKVRSLTVIVGEECGYNRYPDEKGTERQQQEEADMPTVELQPLPR